MIIHENDGSCLIKTHLHGGVWVIPCWITLYDMHENLWECTRLSHNAWACMWGECMRMTENVWEWLIFREGCGSLHADLHYTTCLIMNGNAWAWLRMTWESRIFQGGNVMLGWFTLYDMHDNELGTHQTISSWMNMYVMRMHENAWTCMRLYENDSYSGEGRVIQGWFALGGSPRVTHAPLTTLHSYDDTPLLLYLEERYKHCECMRMHENDWEWLIFRWVIPCWFT